MFIAGLFALTNYMQRRPQDFVAEVTFIQVAQFSLPDEFMIVVSFSTMADAPVMLSVSPRINITGANYETITFDEIPQGAHILINYFGGQVVSLYLLD